MTNRVAWGVALLGVAAACGGCAGAKSYLLFTSHQTVGLDLGGTPEHPDVTFGYKRTEFTTFPVDPGQVPAPSVYAESVVRTGWWDGTRVYQAAATGQAADDFTSSGSNTGGK